MERLRSIQITTKWLTLVEISISMIILSLLALGVSTYGSKIRQEWSFNRSAKVMEGFVERMRSLAAIEGGDVVVAITKKKKYWILTPQIPVSMPSIRVEGVEAMRSDYFIDDDDSPLLDWQEDEGSSFLLRIEHDLQNDHSILEWTGRNQSHREF